MAIGVQSGFDRVVVIGAGAIGGSIAGRLFEIGMPVVLIARGEHARTIQRDGLLVRQPERAFCVTPPCFESSGQVDWRKTDLAIFATKLHDAQVAMDDLQANAGRQVPVVCASNGVHAEQWAAKRFDTVLSMLVWLPATHLLPGEVRIHSQTCPGVLDAGPVCGAVAESLSESLCKKVRGAGFDSQSRTDIRRWKYAKWITNLGSAAQAMVTDDWQSVATVAQAEGETTLSKAGAARVTTEELIERCQKVQDELIEGEARQGGSTWQSRQRGKPLESRWIEGAMADLADEVGVPAPVNRFLSDASLDPRPLLAADVLEHLE